MYEQNRFIILKRSSLMDTMNHTRDGTRQLQRSDDKLVTPPPAPMFNDVTTMYDNDDEDRGGGVDNRSE